jgi:hypothetical protein
MKLFFYDVSHETDADVLVHEKFAKDIPLANKLHPPLFYTSPLSPSPPSPCTMSFSEFHLDIVSHRFVRERWQFTRKEPAVSNEDDLS